MHPHTFMGICSGTQHGKPCLSVCLIFLIVYARFPAIQEGCTGGFFQWSVQRVWQNAEIVRITLLHRQKFGRVHPITTIKAIVAHNWVISSNPATFFRWEYLSIDFEHNPIHQTSFFYKKESKNQTHTKNQVHVSVCFARIHHKSHQVLSKYFVSEYSERNI